MPSKTIRVGPAYWALYGQLKDAESLCVLVIAISCAIGAGVPLPLMALVFKGLIESFPPPDDQLNAAIHYLLAIASAYFALTWMWSVSWGIVGGRISRRLQESLVEKVVGMDMAFFDTEDLELTSILTADTQTVQRGTSEKVGLFIQSITYVIATFVVGFILSPALTGVLLVAIFPAMLILVGVGSKLVSRNSKWAGKYTEKATSAAEQAIKSIAVVQAFSAMKTLSDSHEQILRRAAQYATRKSIFSAVMLASTFFICYSVNALAFYWGAETGGSSGTIYAVVFLILDASFVFTQVGPFIQTLVSASSAGEKILELIKRPPPVIDSYSELGSGISRDGFDSDIACEAISFAYPSRKDHMVLSDVNLTFKAGSTTGIVGPSGSGKSSLVGLLLRLYDATNGVIKIGHNNLKDINLKSFRSLISLVDQEPVLFSGTILENISHGIVDRGILSSDEIRARCIEAAASANVDFLDSLKHGLDTQVGNSGGGLSGGQRQRICLARALVRKPRMLILDEPTSALDSASERKILEALTVFARTGCTIVMIAHRLSTVKAMDNIVVICQGRVQEQGCHQALMSMPGGAYRALVDAQKVESLTTESRLDREKGLELTKKKVFDASISGVDLQEPPSQLVPHIPGRVPGTTLDSVPGQTLDQSDLRRPLSDTSMSVSEEAGKDTTTQAASTWQLLRKCLQLNGKRENIILIIGLGAAAVMGVLIIYEAIVFGHLVTILQSGQAQSAVLDQVKFYCLMFFIISLIALFASGISNTCLGVVAELLLVKIRDNTLRSILDQDQSFFQKTEHSAHRLVAAISSDANHISSLSGSIIAAIFSVCVNIVAGITVALVFAWEIALVLLSVIPAIVLAGFLRVNMLTKFEKKHHDSFKHAAALASEAVQNIRTVAAYGRERDVLQSYRAAITKPYKQNFWFCVFGDLALTLCYCIVFFTFALAYWWGSKQVREGHFSELDFFTMLPAFLLTAQQSGQLFTAAPELIQARTAARRLFKLLDAKPTIIKNSPSQESKGSISGAGQSPLSTPASSSQNTICRLSDERQNVCSNPETPGLVFDASTEKLTVSDFQDRSGPTGASITFARVSLAYPSNPSVQILRDVTIEILSGATVGLVGPSGAGKSSLISLLERFYDPCSGRLFIDGADARDVPAQEHRARLAYVPQEPSLFDGTVAYNISLGALQITDPTMSVREEVELVCKHYGLHDFIISLPEAYDTEVGLNGNKLSGGQRQRLALARALMRRPKILILDEATSALDAHSEKEVQRIMEQVKAEGRTIVMIAHRMSTVRDADEIFVLERGRVTEHGNHDDLIRAKGLYYGMVKAQELD